MHVNPLGYHSLPRGERIPLAARTALRMAPPSPRSRPTRTQASWWCCKKSLRGASYLIRASAPSARRGTRIEKLPSRREVRRRERGARLTNCRSAATGRPRTRAPTGAHRSRGSFVAVASYRSPRLSYPSPTSKSPASRSNMTLSSSVKTLLHSPTTPFLKKEEGSS